MVIIDYEQFDYYDHHYDVVLTNIFQFILWNSNEISTFSIFPHQSEWVLIFVYWNGDVQLILVQKSMVTGEKGFWVSF